MPENDKKLGKAEVATLLAIAIATAQTDRSYVLRSEIATIRKSDERTLARHFKRLENAGYLKRHETPLAGRPHFYELLKPDEIDAWIEEYLKAEDRKAPSQAYRTEIDQLLKSLAWLRKEVCNAF